MNWSVSSQVKGMCIYTPVPTRPVVLESAEKRAIPGNVCMSAKIEKRDPCHKVNS